MKIDKPGYYVQDDGSCYDIVLYGPFESVGGAIGQARLLAKEQDINPDCLTMFHASGILKLPESLKNHGE